jgi:mannosyltransferase OCH1-like enzyme
VAVVNATEVSGWENVRVLKELNPGWVVHVCDNNDKDQFMRDHFFGSKLLWAYETINPVVGGAAKADIWRYAVLFLIGGVCK